VRLLSLLSWRSTHRAPKFLERRREVSGEALDLAQRLRLPARQVEAAAMVAVDAIESGDRPRFDEALGVARWVAQRDGNPRLEWFSSLLAAGAAHLDGDVETASRLRMEARAVGDRIDAPGRLGADLFLLSEELLAKDIIDPDTIRPWILDDDAPELASPLGRAAMATAHAIIGDLDAAARNLRRVLRQFDPEASYLLLGTRCVDVALRLDLPDVDEELTRILTPWADHVAVDSFAWWCDGPVALALAELAQKRGDTQRADRYLVAAEVTVRPMGDVRAIRRVTKLRNQLGPSDAPATGTLLTDREWQVLTRMAKGMTNPEIARDLCYSTSTIRNDLSTIYRKLEVSGRPEAAARAIELGLA
jgi:DNA-binding CsgD family transcriptional regulator